MNGDGYISHLLRRNPCASKRRALNKACLLGKSLLIWLGVEGSGKFQNDVKLVVTGPLKWLWIKLVAQSVADTVPEETEALVRLARSRHE